MVIALFLEAVPAETDESGDTLFEAPVLAESVITAFALGCAMGVEFPERIETILSQTHEESPDDILAECREPLLQVIEESKEANEPLEPDTFVGAIVEALDRGPHVDSETAQNAVSMSFEYGCVLAHVDRGAAMIVRNEQNRAQEAAIAEFADGESTESPEGIDPFQSLQSLAAEVMSAYEADIGF